MTSVERAANVIVKELADNERDERARMTSVECAAKVVERDRKCAEKEAEEEAQRVAKAAERDAKWTAEVDESIESMINDSVSFSTIASKLGNGLKENDIKNRWYVHLKELSGITKPPVQTGFPSRITWTAEVDASIESMLDGGDSFSKMDIKNRWYTKLKKSSSIIKPAVQSGFPSRITWTADVDATIARMRTDGDSFTKIALKLGNGLSTNDISNRWNRHMKDKMQ